MNPDNIKTVLGIKSNKKNIDEHILDMTDNELIYNGYSKIQIEKIHSLRKIIYDVKKINEILRDRILYTSITDPSTAFNYMKDYFINNNLDWLKEHFLVLLMDVRNRYIEIEIVSIGTLTAALVHPRESFEKAIKVKAASIMVCHNHPSSDLSPSEEDIRITRRLKDAGKILGIELLDHLIITPNGYCSLKEKGLI